MNDPILTLEFIKSIGVPFLYLDGVLEFSFQNNDKERKSVDMKYLLNPKKKYYELLLGNKFFDFFISKNEVITIINLRKTIYTLSLLLAHTSNEIVFLSI